MEKRLTIIGTGNMAYAILKGVYESYDVEVVGRNQTRLSQLSEEFDDRVVFTPLEDGYTIEDKRIILAVKPHALEEVSQKLRGKAYAHLSVLAGTKLDTLKHAIPAYHTVRAMPNLAAKYGKSMTTLCGDHAFKYEALAICSCFGKTLWVKSEKEIDIATAIAGSGPAYLALVAEALADGGVKAGLTRESAMRLVEGLFYGMGDLLQEQHPALLKDGVMSPGGTTAAGYGALESGNVRNAFIEAVTAAFARAEALGKK
jgi:pyrroline-5-carboxylate reductase